MSFSLPARLAALDGAYPGLTAGRITQQDRGVYRLCTAAGEQSAVVCGRFRHEAQSPSDYPAVGDYVMAGCDEPALAVIHQVLPRSSLFVRRAAGGARTEQAVAANIDTAFLCMSLNHDFNLRRMERYLSVCRESGARPVIVLTKADLCGDLAQRHAQIASIAMDAPVLTVSAFEADGWRALMPYLAPGCTVAFVGSSGAGKSTLINRLLGEERLATNGLRSDDRGRHTTTRRALLFLPGGAMVIDTPGMRELGLFHADAGMEQTFADVETLAAQCRFRNCTHGDEPGCAVRAALRCGALDGGRWQSYRKLMRENACADSREDYLAAKERKFRDISKFNKHRKEWSKP